MRRINARYSNSARRSAAPFQAACHERCVTDLCFASRPGVFASRIGYEIQETPWGDSEAGSNLQERQQGWIPAPVLDVGNSPEAHSASFREFFHAQSLRLPESA